MAKNAAQIELLVAQQAAVANLQKFAQQFDSMMKRMEGATQKFNRQGKAVGSTIRKWGMEMARSLAAGAGMGSMMQGLSTIQNMIMSNIQRQRQMRREIADLNISEANAMRRALNALGRGADLTPQELDDRLERASTETGVSKKSLALAAETTLSSRGERTAAEAVDVLTKSARLRPDLADQPAELAQLTEGAFAVIKEFNVSADKALSGVSGLFTTARVTDMASLSRNLLPSIMKSRSFSTSETGERDDFNFLAGVAAQISQRSEDPTGRQSATQIEKFFADMKRITLELGFKGTSEQQLKFVQGNLEARRRMFGTFGFTPQQLEDERRRSDRLPKGEARSEVKTKVAAAELTVPGSTGVRSMQDLRKRIGNLSDKDVAEQERFQRQINSSRSQQLATLKRDLDRGRERQMRAQLDEGIRETINESVTKTLLQSGMFGAEADVKKLIKDIFPKKGTVVEQMQAAVDELKARRQKLLATRMVGGGFGAAAMEVEAAPEDVAKARALAMAIEQFELARDRQRTLMKQRREDQREDRLLDPKERQKERQLADQTLQSFGVAPGMNIAPAGEAPMTKQQGQQVVNKLGDVADAINKQGDKPQRVVPDGPPVRQEPAEPKAKRLQAKNQ